jgi:hypothetical protein
LSHEVVVGWELGGNILTEEIPVYSIDRKNGFSKCHSFGSGKIHLGVGYLARLGKKLWVLLNFLVISIVCGLNKSGTHGTSESHSTASNSSATAVNLAVGFLVFAHFPCKEFLKNGNLAVNFATTLLHGCFNAVFAALFEECCWRLLCSLSSMNATFDFVTE